EETGAKLKVINDPFEAAKDADIIYTDVWTSMGDNEDEDRLQALKPYQVNASLMGSGSKWPLFMHCLPAHRGLEVTAEVIDGPYSIVFDEAENRLHAQKALLVTLMR